MTSTDNDEKWDSELDAAIYANDHTKAHRILNDLRSDAVAEERLACADLCLRMASDDSCGAEARAAAVALAKSICDRGDK